MFTDAFLRRSSPVHRLDPRGRVIGATALSLGIAAVSTLPALALALLAAVGLSFLARLPLGATARRLLPLNGFLAVLWLVLPVTTAGPALFHVRTMAVTAPGALAALLVTLKANAIILILTALLTTMESTQLGRALHALRVPARLTTLLLLTGRYIAVLQAEYRQLRRAMRVRCFAPRTDRLTLESLGYLVGMLLVKGFDRSERILRAMKCRGYTGAFPVADPFVFGKRDAVFVSATLLLLGLLGWSEGL